MNIFNYRSFVLVMVIAIFFGNLVLIIDNRDKKNVLTQYPMNSQVTNLENKRSIQVTGNGSVSLGPDIATFSINVVTQRKNATLAREDSASKIKQVFTSLKLFDIAQKDIRTAGYSLYPEYVYEKNKIKKIGAFNVSNNLNVTVRKLDSLGAVIDGIIKLDSGDIRINNIAFDIDDKQVYKTQARELAIMDAITTASEIAKNAGVELGTPTTIIDTEPFYNGGLVGAPRAMKADMEFTPTTIAAGQIVIESKIQVIFAIK